MSHFQISIFSDKFADQHQSSYGVIAIFTLKNPSCPEYICTSPSGVMCLDFHPKRPHMIVAGLVCGNVAVYNLQLKSHKPSYLSSTRNGKHSDIVWNVSVSNPNLPYLTFLLYNILHIKILKPLLLNF